MGVIGALGLFVSIVAHEFYHSLVARRSGMPNAPTHCGELARQLLPANCCEEKEESGCKNRIYQFTAVFCRKKQ